MWKFHLQNIPVVTGWYLVLRPSPGDLPGFPEAYGSSPMISTPHAGAQGLVPVATGNK